MPVADLFLMFWDGLPSVPAAENLNTSPLDGLMYISLTDRLFLPSKLFLRIGLMELTFKSSYL